MAPSTAPRAAWRTSSHSNNGGNCVEVTTGRGAVAVRDTRHRTGPALAFSARAWQRFTGGLKG
jgi:hypothetical protein